MASLSEARLCYVLSLVVPKKRGVAYLLGGANPSSAGSLVGWVLPFDWQGVCLGVEHPLVEGQEVVLGEEQVEVLERLCQEEALLDVVFGAVGGVHVLQAGEAAVHATVLVDGLERRQRRQKLWEFFLNKTSSVAGKHVISFCFISTISVVILSHILSIQSPFKAHY